MERVEAELVVKVEDSREEEGENQEEGGRGREGGVGGRGTEGMVKEVEGRGEGVGEREQT